MKTFRLWLEPDPIIPRFKRLAFELVDVSIADVLKRGVHPWQGAGKHPSLKEKFVEMLNNDDTKSTELGKMGYFHEIGYVCGRYSLYQVHEGQSYTSCFHETLKRIQTSIFFVNDLSYVELLQIAKQRLQVTWDYSVAHRLLESISPSFDAMRSFLKAKDKTLKIS